ncbi:phage tail sheath family protein [Chengkuizengella axinellae]|uniref:Phage tail sheath family protein n=1 Tax=Chengkuizengella axinellae TaxID=3064388 RepID=A0ABT9J6B4_9BACL|nr:phage tail sheath family protein [Chengkuizengella sp. 2205SS18-9]MDP5277144.1 phage tail sheath family protein [Chengkuizengella sp. 2205SS18-9]
MTYKHGISIEESPTSINPPLVSGTVPVVFGTAPSADAPVNEPVLCYTNTEAVDSLGYDDDWTKYTLCEFMYSHFQLFQQSPVVFVNVGTTATATDIVGDVDADGKQTGLELVDQVFPRFGIVPSLILAPGFSHESTVAAAMLAKAGSVNGQFKCLALIDVDTSTNYAGVTTWKSTNNVTSERQILCYPMLSLGDKIFHLSTQLAGVICKVNAENNNIPYESPSNKSLQADGTVLKDGTPMFLGIDQANALNGQGIMTAINISGGFKAWGSRTAAYPTSTDVKDAFIPVRSMFDWMSNTIILTYWNKLDGPITNRLIESITDGINIWFNGLRSGGYILGGNIQYLASENSIDNIIDGKIKFHVYVTPPTPAREISFEIEYDAQYLTSALGV